MAEAKAVVRRTYSITVTLAFAIGSLVAVGVLSVLFLGLQSAQKNTFDLVREQAVLILASQGALVEQNLQPVRIELDFLAQLVASGRLDLSNPQQITDVMTGALGGAQQVAALSFVRPDLTVTSVARDRDRIVTLEEDWSRIEDVRRGIEVIRQARDPVWGELVPSPSRASGAFINIRVPLRRSGEFLGALVALVSTSQLSRFVERLDSGLAGGHAFILYGRDHVLAHAALRDGFRRADSFRPAEGADLLPTLNDIGDPVLAAIWQRDARGRDPERTPLPPRPGSQGSPGVLHFGTVNGAAYIYMLREVTSFGSTPWLMGLYIPATEIEDEIRRLVYAGVAGLGVLLVSLIAAVLLGRRIARPIKRIANAARTMSELRFKDVEHLPPSRIQELNDQSTAFNGLVSGLRWFENYVPRSLVHRLLGEGEALDLPSETREVTVLFTDIVGFTSMSEPLSAADLATFINEHFALINRCIEAEGGTLDKYIGDAVMAFWGAPGAQPDHPARALRAARAIAAAVRAENVARTARGDKAVRLRVGIHSGPAVVGNIGAPGRVNYTIVGDTVNVAQRLEQLGKEVDGGADVCVVASETTVWAAQNPPDFEPLGAYQLRGRGQPLAVFRLRPT